MDSNFTKTWLTFNKTAVASYREFSGIQSKALECFLDQHRALICAVLDGYTAQAKLVADTKNYLDLLAGQAKLISAQGEKILSITRGATGTLENLKSDLNTWVEHGVEFSKLVAPAAAAQNKPTPSAKKAA